MTTGSGAADGSGTTRIVLDFTALPARALAPAFTPAPPRAAPFPGTASYGARVAAALIDGVIVWSASLVLGVLIMLALSPLAAVGDTGLVIVFLLLVTMLPFLLASIVVLVAYSLWTLAREGEHNGQTLGKQALGIRLVRVDGGPVTAGTAMSREVLWKGVIIGFASALLLLVPLLLDILWPLWDDRGQTLHDKGAGTLVVKA